MCTRGDLDIDADVLVVERGDRLLQNAAGGDGGKSGDRNGDAFAEPCLSRESLGCPQLRVGQRACVAVGLQQFVEQAWDVREEDVGRGQIQHVVQRKTLTVDVHRPVETRRAWRRNLQSVLAETRAIELEELDIDDHFWARFVDRGDQRRGRCHALRRVLDRDSVGRRDGGEAPAVDHNPEEVERLLYVGVAEIERADDLFFVFGSFGRRVRNDRYGALRCHAIEVARRR